MIKIEVDEATAFDMLSILYLKAYNSGRGNTEYIRAAEELSSALGSVKCYNILTSSEYADLLNANRQVFKYVDIMNSGKDLSALEVHKANMKRYTAKKNLQKRFFKSELVERKV